MKGLIDNGATMYSGSGCCINVGDRVGLYDDCFGNHGDDVMVVVKPVVVKS